MHREEALHLLHCPRWAELPSIPLYMDQVILLLDEALRPLTEEGEKSVTSTMINNYVKQKLIEPPAKKKYGRKQIAGILFVSVLKRVLSMPEIAGLYARLTEALGPETAYDTFCTELETFIQAAFNEKSLPAVSLDETPESALRAALAAWTGKLTLQQYLAREESK